MLIHSRPRSLRTNPAVFLFSFSLTAWILIFCSVFGFQLGFNLVSLPYHTGSQSDAILIITYNDGKMLCFLLLVMSSWFLLMPTLHSGMKPLLIQKLFAVHADNESGNVFLGAARTCLPERMGSCLPKLIFGIFVLAQHQFWPKALQTVCKATAQR